MGNMCSVDPNQQRSQLSQNPWEFKFGQDMLAPKIQHTDTIKCRVHQIESNVKICQQKLRQSGRLYKDPSIQTKQVILTGKDKTQIHCTYNRPNASVEDKSSKIRKLYQIVNVNHSKISQLLIYNSGLQYFGPLLCFLAEFPELINTIIVTEANSYGLYVVAVNINGKKQYLYIDDFILCQKQHKIPLFSQVIDDKYIWPCLIQKSWMKIHGNVTRKIVNVLPQQIFNTYLSIPTKSYRLSASHIDNIVLLDNHIHNKSKHARCVITTKAEPTHKIGISGRKQYYLLSHFQGQQKKWFYHFSSPCKTNHFRGSNTVQHFKSFIPNYNEEEMEEHTFILDEQQFIEQVEQFLIVYHEKQVKNSAKQQIFLSENQQIYAKVHLAEYDHISICYNQFSLTKQYNPISYHAVYLKTNECLSDLDDPEACFGVRNAYLLQNIYAHVHPGDLLIRIKKRRMQNQKKSIAEGKDHLIVNSKSKITIETSSEKQKQYQEDFHRFLKNQGEKRLQLQNTKGAKNHDDIRYVSYWLGNLAVVYVKKLSKQKAQLKLQVNFPQLKNLQCLNHPYLKQQFASLQLTQDSLLIIFEKIDPAQETVFGKYTIQAY